MKRLLAPSLALALALAACTSAESTGIAPVTCDPASTLTYANFGAQFLDDHCLSCHQSKESPRLATVEQLRANATHVLQEAVYTTAMPEDEALPIETREMLGQWIACGAP